MPKPLHIERTCINSVGYVMKPREVLKKLKEAGWEEVKGRNHVISVISPTGQRVPISNHPSKDIATGTLKNTELLTGVKLS